MSTEHHLDLSFSDIEKNEDIDPNEIDDAFQPFDELKNLVWIQQNTVYKVALEEWERKEKLLLDRTKRKRKRSGALKKEIYLLLLVFSVFQGLMLTTVTILTQSKHSCKRVWSPVLLTALSWACTVFELYLKSSRIEVIQDERFEEYEAFTEAVKRAQLLRNLGNRFRFRDLKETQKLYRNFSSSHFRINRFSVVVVMLSLFTGIIIVSYFLILCDRG